MELTTLLLIFTAYTHDLALPKGLLPSLCYIESNYKINAIHKDDGGGDSLGVCQIKLTTAKLLGFKGTQKELMKPEINIKYAAKYLKKQLNRYKNDSLKAIAAYNAGTYRENRNGMAKNKKYVNKVLLSWSGTQ